jgi:hypothetical protein
LTSRPSENVHLRASVRNAPARFLRAEPFRPRGTIPKPEAVVFRNYSSETCPSPLSLGNKICFGLRLAYPAGDGSAAILLSPQRCVHWEGIFEEAQAQAVKDVVAWQLAEAMKKKKIS